MITSEELRKFAFSPGLCSPAEVENAREFFKQYQEFRDIYREVYGCDPMGFMLEGDIEKTEWYKDWHKNWHKNKGQK